MAETTPGRTPRGSRPRQATPSLGRRPWPWAFVSRLVVDWNVRGLLQSTNRQGAAFSTPEFTERVESSLRSRKDVRRSPRPEREADGQSGDIFGGPNLGLRAILDMRTLGRLLVV